jgi:hypothetical protein
MPSDPEWVFFRRNQRFIKTPFKREENGGSI